MSKFKVGDKVVVGGGDIKTIARIDKWRDGEYGYYFNIDDELLNYYEEEDLELYKTPHQRLLDMGFEEFPRYNERYYILDNDEQYIEIYIDIKGVNYYVPNNEYVDLELAEVLVDYLKELENE